ncbi:MAG: hypothetical protein QOI97_509 [Pseudomonas sp.]|jgi:hypothetical protein|nr:hypothetical protein [Pseudomonas sp.]
MDRGLFFAVFFKGLFASKPAPTFDRVYPVGTQSNVGAVLLAKAAPRFICRAEF